MKPSGIALAALVFSLGAVAVAAAEWLLALHDPGLVLTDPVTGSDDRMFYRYDPRLGLRLKSGFSGTKNGIRYTTNSQGLRGRELTAAEPGRRRILLLGDSLVWGWGVGDDETLAAALELLLPDTDVINLGVAGFGTGQELLLLEEQGWRHGPDEVVLVFCVANDVEDNFLPDTIETYPANFFTLEGGKLAIVRFEPRVTRLVAMRLLENSYLINFLLRQLARTRGGTEGGDPEPGPVEALNLRRFRELAIDPSPYRRLDYLRPRRPPPPEAFMRRGGLLLPTPLNHYKVELTKELIREMARRAAAHGARFRVVISPYRAQLEPGSAHADNPLHEELVAFLAREGIEALDLLPRLQRHFAQSDQLFLDGMHYSPAGLRLLATWLAEELGGAIDGPSTAQDREARTDQPGSEPLRTLDR